MRGCPEAVDRARRPAAGTLFRLGERTRCSEAAEGFGGFGALTGGPFGRPERGPFSRSRDARIWGVGGAPGPRAGTARQLQRSRHTPEHTAGPWGEPGRAGPRGESQGSSGLAGRTLALGRTGSRADFGHAGTRSTRHTRTPGPGRAARWEPEEGFEEREERGGWGGPWGGSWGTGFSGKDWAGLFGGPRGGGGRAARAAARRLGRARRAWGPRRSGRSGWAEGPAAAEGLAR